MSDTGRFEEILATVKAAYGSLEEPNYTFAQKRLRKLRQHPIIGDLMARYFVRDETDLNNDLALRLRVLHDEGSCAVCLSLVDRWAMFFRLAHESRVYADNWALLLNLAYGRGYLGVIDSSCSGASASEQDIIELLHKHGFKLLSKAEAALPLPMNLFDTERDEARVYHAVVADDGETPEVLLH